MVTPSLNSPCRGKRENARVSVCIRVVICSRPWWSNPRTPNAGIEPTRQPRSLQTGSRDQQLNLEGKLRLSGARGPACGIAHGREGMAMERRGAMLAKGFEMVWRSVALVARQAVLRINGVPLFHTSVAMSFREDRSCRDGDAPGIALDQ